MSESISFTCILVGYSTVVFPYLTVSLFILQLIVPCQYIFMHKSALQLPPLFSVYFRLPLGNSTPLFYLFACAFVAKLPCRQTLVQSHSCVFAAPLQLLPTASPTIICSGKSFGIGITPILSALLPFSVPSPPGKTNSLCSLYTPLGSSIHTKS